MIKYCTLFLLLFTHTAIFGQANLTVNSSTVLGANGGVYISVADAQLIINGTFTGNSNSTLEIKGTATAENSKIGGTGSISFNNLVINKTTNNCQLSSSIAVNNSLTIQNGSLDIQANTIDLGSAGSLLNETNTTRIFGTTGTITAANRTIPLGATSNVANLGAEITPNGAAITSMNIIRGVAPQTVTSNQGIYKFYDISTTPVTGLNATLKFNYFDLEYDVTHGGTNEILFDLWRSTDLGATWTAKNATANPSANFVTMNGIDQFSRWTISKTVTVLPVKLLNFSALPFGNRVETDWSTATEINNDHFTVEKSSNALNWNVLGTITGAGNSSMVLNYHLTDDYPYAGQSYYRLKQTDFDGKSEYSKIVSVRLEQNDAYLNRVYPNPVSNDQFNLFITAKKGQEVLVTLLEPTGKMVFTKKTMAESNENIFHYNLPDLARGTYYLIIKVGPYFATKKVMINK